MRDWKRKLKLITPGSDKADQCQFLDGLVLHCIKYKVADNDVPCLWSTSIESLPFLLTVTVTLFFMYSTYCSKSCSLEKKKDYVKRDISLQANATHEFYSKIPTIWLHFLITRAAVFLCLYINPLTPKLIIQILLTIQEQMYEWCSENW